MTESSEISAALAWVPSDDRDTWVRVGMALKNELDEEGFTLWLGWSQSSSKYREADALSVWRSIRPDGAVRIATLYHLAQRHGWRSGKLSRPPLKPVASAPKAATERDTRAYALSLWECAEREDEAVASHPYAQTKGIEWAAGAGRGKASGRVVGKDADCLLIPCQDIQTGHLTAIQAINPQGAKQTFGRMENGALVLGNTLDKRLPWFVVEGWADAVSLCFHHYEGNAVAAAAFGQSRLETVARVLAEKYGPDQIVIVDDREAA